jgi:hypothetical protein
MSIERVSSIIGKSTNKPTIVNNDSKFVVVTYWWGRGNLNANIARPCISYYEEMIQKESYTQFIDLEKMYENKQPYHRLIDPSQDNSKRFEPTVDIETLYTGNTKSSNQRLVGPPNPKTLEAPIITPRSHDLEHWKTNNLVVPSMINKTSNYDNFGKN